MPQSPQGTLQSNPHNRMFKQGKAGRKRVSAEHWNLIAAVLCTIAAAVTAYALLVLYFSAPIFVNGVAAIGGMIGTAGGLAWIIAAAIGVRQR
jgi:hypothetical protein